MNHDPNREAKAPCKHSDVSTHAGAPALPRELRALESELRAARPRPPAGLRDAVLEATRLEIQRERRRTACRFAAASLLVAWGGLHALRSLTDLEGTAPMAASAAPPRPPSLETSEARVRELKSIWPTADGAETVAYAQWLEVRAGTLHDATRRARVELGAVVARRGS